MCLQFEGRQQMVHLIECQDHRPGFGSIAQGARDAAIIIIRHVSQIDHEHDHIGFADRA